MSEVKVLSPAKVNLFLEVISKREDGYHEIETVLQAIDIQDEVILRDKKEGIKIICSHEGVPRGKGNLAYRAAQAILKETHLRRGVEIEIKKEIPIAAGLGGGSSNAAAVLVGLRKLWNLKLSRKRLEVLAKGLGMDVPFFIKGGRALGRGRGEELTSLKGWQPFWLTVVVPDIRVSTARVYRSLNLVLTRKRKLIKIVINDLKDWSGKNWVNTQRTPFPPSVIPACFKQESGFPLTDCGNDTGLTEYLQNWSSILYNRLKEVTEKKYPQVRRVEDKLRALGGVALMSGSGPAVFGIFPERRSAERAGAIIKEELAGSHKARKPGSGKGGVYVAKTFSGGASIVHEEKTLQPSPSPLPR